MPRSPSRFRIAVLLLSLAAAGLVAVLASCPQEKTTGKPPAARRTAVEEPPSGDVAPTAPDDAAPPGEAAALPRVRGRLALVIDDAGYDLEELQPYLDLTIPLAVAVLPNLPRSAEAARRVLAAGKELLLHLPMEPEGGEDPGPGALLTGMSAAEIESRLDAALASVPGASGVNNHMGSKATADTAFMDAVLASLGRRGLFFVDSRTTTLTVAASEARLLGVPYLARKVFLDAVEGDAERSLEAAVAAAARYGAAVAVGHVQTEGLAAILRRAADGMGRSGVGFAPLSALVAGADRGAAE